MANRMLWRYGETNPVVANVDADTVIEIGDLVWLDGDTVKPASVLLDQGTLDANRQLFADKFLGVAMQQSRQGDTAPVRVATSGVFELDCPAVTFQLGDLVGPAAAGQGTTLANQQVTAVTTPAQAIGRVAKVATQPTTKVLVSIVSTVMAGGVEGTSA